VLWDRFRSTCDHFFNNRDLYFKKLDGDKVENLKVKEGLCAQVENLDSIESNSEKFNLIKKVQAEWKTIGPVDRNIAEDLWKRFRKPIDAFFEERKDKFEIEQKSREENFLLKEALCKQAIDLSESKSWKDTSEKMKALQAEWKKIGPAPREKDKDIWVNFRSACDNFFTRMKDHYRQLDDQRELNLRTKEDLCFQAESLAGFEESSESEEEKDWSAASGQIKELQVKWKKTGPVPKSRSDELWFRFRKACDYIFDYVRCIENEKPIDHEKNLGSKQELCEDAEMISQQVHTEAQLIKIKDLQREWKQIGPVPIHAHSELWERFKNACDVVFAGDERLQH
jgi:hypothetical protein